MVLTNDQYLGLAKLTTWYRKYKHQHIEVAGIIGTGTFDLVKIFLDQIFDDKEIMYLSYNQKQILDMAYRKQHAYHINSIIYKYIREVDMDTLSVINYSSRQVKYHWVKQLRKKINPMYKIIVVFDSVLLNRQTIQDLSSFGLPIVLIRDSELIPIPDSYTFTREPEILLREINDTHMRNPIVHFAEKILNGERIEHGNYDSVSILSKKQLNLYNLRSSDMNITITDESMTAINNVYRQRIMKRKDLTNIVGERLIISETVPDEKLVNKDNKDVKVYFARGTVGHIQRITRHQSNTKYVSMDFQPDFYHESFTTLMMDRHHLNGLEILSQQMIPSQIYKFNYAYALTPQLARYGTWDKVTLLIDSTDEYDTDIQRRLIYTGITRANKSLTIII